MRPVGIMRRTSRVKRRSREIIDSQLHNLDVRLAPFAPRPTGFTLVEILIVVVLLAILASVLVPAMGDSATSQLRGASLILGRDIQYVQAEAMNTGQTLQINFTSATRYEASDPDGGVGGTPVLLRHPQSDYPQHNNQFIVDFSDPGPLRGTTITSPSFGGQPRLEFGKYGEPAAGGQVILRSRGYQVRISVAPITGLVSVGELEKAP